MFEIHPHPTLPRQGGGRNCALFLKRLHHAIPSLGGGGMGAGKLIQGRARYFFCKVELFSEKPGRF